MPDTIRYGFIHSALCPLFTLSIRVLHSNAGHIPKKSLVMSLFPLALGHIDKKLFVMSLFPLTPGHIVEKSLVMSPSPSAPGHIDKNHLRCPISTVLWDIQTIFLYMSQLYKKKDIIKNFFCICPSTTPHCPSFYLTVSCLTTSSNRFVRCLISSCETP